MTILYAICQVVTVGITGEIINLTPVVIFSLILGSTLVLAGEEFGKEMDSNKIYAYSASIIALISCLVGIIAMLRM